jgi:hypothetical protein
MANAEFLVIGASARCLTTKPFVVLGKQERCLIRSDLRACLKKRTDWFGGGAVKEKRIKCLI